MGEESSASASGGNGERLTLQLGSRSVGLQTRDLIPILLLVILGVGGYLLYDAISKDIGRLDHQLEQVLTALQTNAQRMVEAIHEGNQHRAEQTEAIRKMLLVHEANQMRDPGARLPLELDPDLLPSPQKTP